MLYDLFSDGRWIGMAEGADRDDAKRMAARSLPSLLGRFTLVPWYGRLHPDNCKSSGGRNADPAPEKWGPTGDAAIEAGAEVMAASEMIEAPKLPAECWHGLTRAVLEAALSAVMRHHGG
jgi:hypothetical protein